MFTRQQYMSVDHSNRSVAAAAHRKYFAQFVTPGVKNTVIARIGKKRLVESQNPYFNDIPLKEWDALRGFVPRGPADIIGPGGWSLSDAVCTLKEAARQIVEGAK
jgi:hypothetical protein